MTRDSFSFGTGSWKDRLMGNAGQPYQTMRMIAGLLHVLIAHARGRSMENHTPSASSGFFRQARTLRVNVASFYLESNCMECLLIS